ncbi:g11753 [Coccomyxa elongata]
MIVISIWAVGFTIVAQGSRARYFAKYIDLWKDLGHPTLGIRPQTRSIVAPLLGDRAATEFLRQIQDAQAQHPSRAVVYHIFSNAGFIFFGTMLRTLAQQDEELFIKIVGRPPLGARRPSPAPLSLLEATAGIVLDSAPSRLTPDIAARGLTAAVLGEPAQGIEVRRPSLTQASKFALRPVLGLPMISSRISEIWSAWDHVAPVRPQLYLYSPVDVLIPPAEVERFMTQQVARGVTVQSKVFPDSPHCEHYRKYPMEYKEQLSKFLAGL